MFMDSSNYSNKMCSRRTQDKNRHKVLALARQRSLALASPPAPATPPTPVTPGSGPASGIREHELQKQLLMQKQLALLFHAQKCSLQLQEQCPTPHCTTMKSVLGHMNECVTRSSTYIEDAKCLFPYCASSTAILSHWKNCTAKLLQQCIICEPVTTAKPPSTSTSTSTPTKKVPAATTPKSWKVNKGQFRHCSWTGSMEWHQRSKALQNIRNATLSCQVFTPGALNTACWPDKLHLKLIPAQIVDQVAVAAVTGVGNSSWDGQKVLLKFGGDSGGDRDDDPPEVAELRAALLAGSYGYVHFDSTGPGGGLGCPLKMLIVRYDGEEEAFIGCLPTNQKEFVKKLRYVVQQQIQVQNQSQNGQGQQSHQGQHQQHNEHNQQQAEEPMDIGISMISVNT